MIKHRFTLSVLAVIFVALAGYYAFFHSQKNTEDAAHATVASDMKTKLSPEAYDVMYNAGTERPFSSPLDHETRPGTYVSADTGLPLFRSEDKYDSGTGWPSFTKPISPDAVILREDNLLGLSRTEVLTKDTHAHLGHVFDDGPPPLGKRWCMNGVALRFIPD